MNNFEKLQAAREFNLSVDEICAGEARELHEYLDTLEIPRFGCVDEDSLYILPLIDRVILGAKLIER